jgi:hypothetical protein
VQSLQRPSDFGRFASQISTLKTPKNIETVRRAIELDQSHAAAVELLLI